MTERHAQFRRQGYVTLPGALDADELATLRRVCDTLLDEPVDDGGSGRHKIGLGEDRRFMAHRHEEFPELESLILGERMAALTSELLGQDALLFNEQFVVKGADSGASFAWHQDGAYVGYDHAPYLTVWMALDDTTEENGCVYVLPRNLDARPDLDPHTWLDDTRELNGYEGSESGIPAVCPAGSIVAFSSVTLHRSGANTTDRRRRAYICQYSVEPIRDPKTGGLKRFAKPLGRARVETAA